MVDTPVLRSIGISILGQISLYFYMVNYSSKRVLLLKVFSNIDLIIT